MIVNIFIIRLKIVFSNISIEKNYITMKQNIIHILSIGSK